MAQCETIVSHYIHFDCLMPLYHSMHHWTYHYAGLYSPILMPGEVFERAHTGL